MSDASGTLWLDIKKRQWSDQLLSCSFLGQKHMPNLVEGNQETGILKYTCLLYTSPSPRDYAASRMPSSA